VIGNWETCSRVVAFADPIALGAKWVGTAFNKFCVFEKRDRRKTAVVFNLASIHYFMIFAIGPSVYAIIFQRHTPAMEQAALTSRTNSAKVGQRNIVSAIVQH
jgi:hypothetical protein